MDKQVYMLIPIQNPETRNTREMNCYHIYANEFRNMVAAEMEIELEDDPALMLYTSEQWNTMLDKRVDDALVMLKKHGRYPVTGVPEFVYM